MSLTSKEFALKAAEAALKKKALDLIILDLSGLTVIADYFVICSGESTTQVKAIAEFVEHEFIQKGIRPAGKEGLNFGHWVLLDYGDVIIHIFEKETREYYNLEKLWMDAKPIEFHEDTSDMGGKDKRAVHS
jgi:ribosome-associated protein